MAGSLLPATNKEILPLTSLRSFAALYIFIFHCQIHYGPINNKLFLNSVIDQGQIAMTFFFLLSGYIMTYVYKSINGHGIRNYYVNRIARVYPTYIAYGLIGLPLFMNNMDAAQSIYSGRGFDHIVMYAQIILAFIAFILMIQAWFPNLFHLWNFGGSWALSVEAVCYLAFPALRKFTTYASINTLLFLLLFSYLLASVPVFYACMFTSNESFSIMNRYTYISPVFRLGEFLFGIIIYVLSEERKLSVFRNGTLALLFLIILLLFLLKSWAGLSFLSFITIPAFAWSISWIRNKKIPLLESKIMVYTGHISYSFYLSQFFVFSIAKETIKRADMTMATKWLIAFIVTTILAIALYHLVEKRCRLYIKRKFEKHLSGTISISGTAGP
jgi:peptidoglycan/LPS O-acetylase OafA/YrhL